MITNIQHYYNASANPYEVTVYVDLTGDLTLEEEIRLYGILAVSAFGSLDVYSGIGGEDWPRFSFGIPIGALSEQEHLRAREISSIVHAAYRYAKNPTEPATRINGKTRVVA